MLKRKIAFSILILGAVQSYANWSVLYSRSGGSPLNAGTSNTDAPFIEVTNGGFTNGVFQCPSPTDLSGVSTNGSAASFFPDGDGISRWVAYITDVDDVNDRITVTRVQSKSGTEISASANGITMRIDGAWTLPVNSSTNRHPLRAYGDAASHVTVGLTNRRGYPVVWAIKGSGGYTLAANGLAPATDDYTMVSITTNTAPGPIHIRGFVTNLWDKGFAKIHFDTNAAFNGLSPWTFSGAGGYTVENLWIYGGGTPSAGSTHNNGLINFTVYVDGNYCIGSGAWESAVNMASAASKWRNSFFFRNQRNSAAGKGVLQMNGTCEATGNVFYYTFRDADPTEMGANAIVYTGSSSTRALVEQNIFWRIRGKCVDQTGNQAILTFRNNTCYDIANFALNYPHSASGATNLNSLEVNGNLFVNVDAGVVGNSSNPNPLFVPRIYNNAHFQATNGFVVNFSTNRVENNIALSANPFVDPSNGNFSLNNSAGGGALVKGVNGPTFLQMHPDFIAATGSFQDIGAVQHQDSGGSSVTPSGWIIVR